VGLKGDLVTQDLRFPSGFVWGVATASHQVEGDNTNNQWYAWERKARLVPSGLACDWWRHAEADFDRAQQMGITGMRLSLEWSRIEPDDGRWDDAAIERYRAMLRGLRERGIEPLVTLHHYTFPIWLERYGGFAGEEVIPRFARYATKCVETYGDLCDFWCTTNEPNVYALFGYISGTWPPGKKGALVSMIRAQANLLRAHAAGYRAIHAAQPAARVSLAHAVRVFDPANARSPLDRFAASWRDAGFNGLTLDALTLGRVRGLARGIAGDLGAVRDTYDFVGVNYYSRDMVAFDALRPQELFSRTFTPKHAQLMDDSVVFGETFGEIYPEGMRRVLQRLARMGKPIYVTENGVADRLDNRRPAALVRTLESLYRALQDGVDVRGYYHWSLIDNYEWAEGWNARFGLIAVDPSTQVRTPRPSAHLYERICRANALPEDVLDAYDVGVRYAPTER
jgi:beta-glucosidase